MKIEKKLNNLYLIKTKPFIDNRGIFSRIFCKRNFKKMNLNNSISQINLSYNNEIGTLRGLHYQKGKYAEIKMIKCIKGKIFFVALDIDKKSKTYLKHKKFILEENDNKLLYIGSKFATGFLTLKKSTEIIYFMSNFYKPDSAKGLRYNDPKLKIKWPSKPKVISKKDLSFKLL